MKPNQQDVIGGAPARSTPLESLRDATHECHQRLEATIDWPQALGSLACYQQLLTCFLSVVKPAEEQSAKWLVPDPPPDFEPGVRTAWLERDLRALAGSEVDRPSIANTFYVQPTADLCGARAGAGNPVDDFGFIGSWPAAIGAQYVLEGSSLGGQFLSRQLEHSLSLTSENGGAYFAAYGTATMPRWKSFKLWANERLANSDATQAASEAAVLLFARFQTAAAELAK